MSTESELTNANTQPVVPGLETEKEPLVDDGTKIPEEPSSEKEGYSPEDKASKNPDQKEDDNTTQDAVMNAEAWAFALSQLARQLEYYLSRKNLSHDTYVETLRKLNDGCVPASILANFGKVNQILVAWLGFSGDEQLRIQAVCEAASHCSNKLRVVTIDAKTGKQVTEEGIKQKLKTNTIVAIGTTDNQPIAVLDPPVTAPASQQFANAIVLRDVASEVTSEDIQNLFQYEGCPSVVSITPDVANCWFVYLDTTKRLDVMDVLLQLRTKTLAGTPVHARIKTSCPTVSIDPSPLMFSQSWEMQPQQQQGTNKGNNQNSSSSNRRKNKKKGSNSRSNNKKKGSNYNNNNNNKSDADNNGSNNKKKDSQSPQSGSNSTPSKQKTTVSPPPAFKKEDFPTLVDNKVEWETPPVQDEAKMKESQNTDQSIGSKDEKNEGEEVKSDRVGCDNASTATTASSSTEPGPKKVGYAAALKSSSTPNLANMANNSLPLKTPETSVSPAHAAVMDGQAAEETPVTASPLNLAGAGWGRRSFADILREAQAAS